MKSNDTLWQAIKENYGLALALLGMVATLANLWVASSVAPLATQIVQLQAQAAALERTVQVEKENDSGRLDRLNSRLDRIEGKIDTLIIQQGGK